MNVQNGVSADILYIGRGFSMERKYSYLDQLSIEQLEDLLRAQRDASSADKDTAFCEAIEGGDFRERNFTSDRPSFGRG